MNKVAAYLQEHLDGEVLVSDAVRQFFAADASVLTLLPTMIVYPQATNDVRKVMRFCWQLAERGHVLPITARGSGTDLSGAAIGSGLILVMPAHMNKLLEFDVRQNLARVQPGLNYRTLQETMMSHHRFLPPYPASIDYSTIGGAIANNSAGEKSVKYGPTARYISKLEVVLANGELIQTGRVNKRELNRKKGGTSLEAEIYRQIDGIVTDNWDLIQTAASQRRISKNTSGYNLADIKHKDGSFDLTPLFVGSQGTLGIVVEAIIKLEPYNSRQSLLVAEFDNLEKAHDALTELKQLGPSALEMVDHHLLAFVAQTDPKRLIGLLQNPNASMVLLAEFDDAHDRKRIHKAKKAEKLLRKYSPHIKRTDDPDEQAQLWKIRHAAALVTNYQDKGKVALPIIEDGIVPQDQFQAYVEQVYALFEKYHLSVALWGHAGDANLHMQPMFDLSKLVDRQRVPKLMEDYYDLVINLGGSIAAEHNDGRLRTPFLEQQFGPEMVEVFAQVHHACDPHGILNPGVKQPNSLKDVMSLLRKDYELARLGAHLPRI